MILTCEILSTFKRAYGVYNKRGSIVVAAKKNQQQQTNYQLDKSTYSIPGGTTQRLG